jgi:hypothetical protein
MARIHFWQYIVDEEGTPIGGVSIRFFLADDTNTEANIYANSTVGHQTTTSAINLLSNGEGYFEFWVGDEWELNGGYPSTQRFRIEWTRAGMREGVIDYLDIFPPLYQVDETIAGQALASEAVKRNKLVSNRLAYRWEEHVEAVVSGSVYRADAPHDIQPVIVCDTDTEYNKVISNNLMNQIYTIALSAGTATLDASAADIDFSRIPLDHPWIPSGALFYADITHNLNNQYPILQVVDTTTNNLVIPEAFESLNLNSTRVVFSSSASQYIVTAIG